MPTFTPASVPVCRYVCLCLCLCPCLCLRLRLCPCVCACACMCVCVCARACVCVCACVRACVRVCDRIDTLDAHSKGEVAAPIVAWYMLANLSLNTLNTLWFSKVRCFFFLANLSLKTSQHPLALWFSRRWHRVTYIYVHYLLGSVYTT